MLSAAILFTALTAQTGDAYVVAWLKTKAVPLTTVEAGKGLADMSPLATTLKDVQIVGMGECTHGSREVFQMKHRMLEFLVEKLGYRVFALEASMPDCVAMDEYVMKGQGDPANALAAQGFWTWNTQEVLALLKWMRAYNADSKNAEKLRVVGIDMQNRFGAAEFLKKKLKKLGKDESTTIDMLSYGPPKEEYLRTLSAAITEIAPQVSPEELRLIERVAVVLQQSYGTELQQTMSAHQQRVGPYLRETLLKAEGLLKDFPALQGDAMDGIALLARGAKELIDFPAGGAKTLRAYADDVRKFGLAQKDKTVFEQCAAILEYFAFAEENKTYFQANFRDKCMADNTEWVHKTYLPGKKIMLWAHNYHVSQTMKGGKPDSTGAHLRDRYKDAYYPVGFAFLEGSFQAMGVAGKPLQEWTVKPAGAETLEGVLDKVGKPIHFIDLSGAAGPVEKWLHTDIKSRSVGALYSPDYAELYYQAAKPAELYRGLIYIKKTTRARPN